MSSSPIISSGDFDIGVENAFPVLISLSKDDFHHQTRQGHRKLELCIAVLLFYI